VSDLILPVLPRVHASVWPRIGLERPRKDAIDALRKQTNSYAAERNRLRYVQDSHVAISRLPPELLSEVFLCLVDSGVEHGNTSFSLGTFNFLQVCRRWNEVAIGFPRLWVWRIPGAAKAWPLFNTRSKNAPLFLTWRPGLSIPSRNIMMDPTIPRRIRRLDFSGNIHQLARRLGVFDSSAPSDISSIRLQIVPQYYEEPPQGFTRFLSSAFPKLSELDIEDFIPDSTSPIFTTSNLTSLKLYYRYIDQPIHTLPEFLDILQRHPNLQALDLQEGALPLPEPSVPLVPLVLPRLVDLRLRGLEWGVTGIVDLIGVSSPLRNIVILIPRTLDEHTEVFVDMMKKILAVYYGCPGLDHPSTSNCLTISLRSSGHNLAFDTRLCSTPTSYPTSNLDLHINGIWDERAHQLARDAFTLFPVDRIQEFTAVGLNLPVGMYRTVFRKMECLLHLRLDNLDIGPVSNALRPGIRGVHGKTSKIMLNHLHAHRSVVSTARTQTTIVNSL